MTKTTSAALPAITPDEFQNFIFTGRKVVSFLGSAGNTTAARALDSILARLTLAFVDRALSEDALTTAQRADLQAARGRFVR